MADDRSEKMRTVEIVPTDAPVGAEIRGVDLSRPLSDTDFQIILDAFHEHGVIFFRDQALTPEQQIAFSRRFGSLEKLPLSRYALPGHSEILLIANIEENGENGEKIGIHDAGKFWHSDSSYLTHPSRCSCLYAREVPKDADGLPLGDTLFAPTFGLYETLPPERQAFLDGLTSIHRIAARLVKDKVAEAEHPVIVRHPVTRRKCIFVNEGLTVSYSGLNEEDGLKLRRELVEMVTAPERIYRHKWRVGDLLMWDNVSTQHHATHDYAWPEHRRLMHRTSVEGEAPTW